MKGPIAWFASNRVAANLAMTVIVLAGLASIPTLTQELIPQIELDMVSVTIAYPGASPAEVEASITNRVEDELQGLQGVKRMRSTSAEGMSAVTVELFANEDVRRRLDDVRAAVESIDTLPEEAEEPRIEQIEIGNSVLNITVAGLADEWSMKRLAQQVRDEVASLPGITDVEIALARDYEISIEVSEARLQSHGLTFDDVVRAVRASSLDLPGGAIKTEVGEILLRAKGQAYAGVDFADIALLSRRDGTRLRLGDVAEVRDDFAESDQASRFDGAPALIVEVFRVGDQKSLEISETVRKYVAEARERMPAGIELTVWHDESTVLRDRLETMIRNARGGFVLVVLILALFLRLRLAFWVSLGIPISFLGAIALMPPFDMSINFVSLMAFILVLGIVVDDAIVVGENVHTHQSESGDKLMGAIEGTRRIVVPVTFGVLTTVAAFLPMAFLPGPTGRMTRVVPIIVISCLAFSLFESMFILPAHLSHGRRALDHEPTTRVSRGWRRFQSGVGAWLENLITLRYQPSLKRALEWRYLTLAVALSLLLVTAGLLGGGHLKFVFQDEVEADFIVAELTMTQGTPAEVTARVVEGLERAAYAVQAEVDAERTSPGPPVFKHLMASIGAQPFKARRSMGRRGTNAAHLGEVQVEVVGRKQREISVTALRNRWREAVGDVPGAVALTFESTLMSMGAPIEIDLSGHDLAELRAAAKEVEEKLASYAGVYEITDSFRGGKLELEYQILPSAETLGLTLADLAKQLRQGFYGDTAQTVQRGRDEVEVVVRYPERDRRSLANVEGMRIRGASGAAVPFSSVATAELTTGLSSIGHTDRRRVVTVTADVDLAMANANEIVADLQKGALPEILSRHPGVRSSFEGEQANQNEFLTAMRVGLGISLVLIYILLAIPLSSYTQPLIIMSAIPFGVVGAAWGHVLLGYRLTMYSVIGLVALAGVVVNASLVLVDDINQRMRNGASMRDAIVAAGGGRFRPILLTSLTTFAGLTPMMLETSLQARFMIPMAVSIAFGVVFSSAITLYLVPAGYLIVRDVARLAKRGLKPLSPVGPDPGDPSGGPWNDDAAGGPFVSDGASRNPRPAARLPDGPI